MYLLLTPLEDTTAEVLHHNTLFFIGLWQLELVSMKFESLLPAFASAAQASLDRSENTVSARSIRAHQQTEQATEYPGCCPPCPLGAVMEIQFIKVIIFRVEKVEILTFRILTRGVETGQTVMP
jgi:hypothetical protein